MKMLILILSGILVATGLHAQTRFVPIKEVVQLSLEHSAQLRKARLDRQIVDAKILLQKSAARPQVKAGAQIDAYPVLPTQFLPAAPFGGQEGEYIPATFGQPWQLTGNLHAEQLLYNASGMRMRPAIEVTRNLSDLLIQKNTDEVAYQTATIFYQYLQTRQLLRSVEANSEKLSSLQRIAELQLKNGYLTPLEVKRIRVARTNLGQQRLNLLTALDGIRGTLQFLCGVPYEASFEPANEPTALVASDSAQWLALSEQYEQTVEWRLISQQSKLLQIQSRAATAENRPSVSLYANAWLQQQRTNPNFFDVSKRWYGMAGLGLKVEAPLFDGYRIRHKKSLLQLDQLKLDEDANQLKSAKSLEFRQARALLLASLDGLRTQSENVALATDVSEKISLQYKEGGIPLTDLLNAQTAQSEAETYYWQQVFTYKLAVLKLAKAAGVLEQVWNR